MDKPLTSFLRCLLLPLALLAWCCLPAFALTETQLQHALSAYVAHSALAGAEVGCEVRTLDGHTVYQHHADRALIPASNVKLLVSATAVDLYGPQYAFGGQVWSEQAPGPHGVLAGNLYLVGCAAPDGSQSVLWPLAKSLQSKGVKQISGDVVGTGAVQASDRDHGLKSAQRLCDVLGQLGLKVTGRARDGFCPCAPVLLADCPGLSLADYLRETNKLSENHLAQCLLDSLLASFADPAHPDPDFLLNYWSLQGLDTSGETLADGSGYSRDNRLTPQFLAGVLTRMAATPAGYKALSRSLPVAGVDGTLEDRMQGTAAEGCVRAKTGTLPQVSSLSGYVERDNRARLVFSILMNGFSCSVETARRIQDRMAVAMAEYVKS